MQKILITLTKEEWEALAKLSIREHRPARYQAELIFRDALSAYGIVKLLEEPEEARPEVKKPAKKIKRRDLSPAEVTQPT